MDSKNKITATVCVYSGRPNPYWTIGAKEYNKLLLSIEKLPLAEYQLPQSLLGYSGIIISAGEKRIYAFNGIITITEEKKITGHTDKNRSIEKQILATAPSIIQKEIKGMLPLALQ